MDTRSKFRDIIKYRAGALCLVGILTATFLHSTTFMSQFFYNSLILGAIAAFAIDAGVVAMSIFKDDLLKDGQLAWMVRIVTSCVLFASGVANMSEGFKSAYGIQLTYDSMLALDPLIWVQWLAGTIIFPILAYVMCDTIGTRNLVDLRKAQAKADKPQKGRNSASNGDANFPKMGRQKVQQRKAEKIAEFARLRAANPDAKLSQLADACGISTDTARRYIAEIEKQKPRMGFNAE